MTEIVFNLANATENAREAALRLKKTVEVTPSGSLSKNTLDEILDQVQYRLDELWNVMSLYIEKDADYESPMDDYWVIFNDATEAALELYERGGFSTEDVIPFN